MCQAGVHPTSSREYGWASARNRKYGSAQHVGVDWVLRGSVTSLIPGFMTGPSDWHLLERLLVTCGCGNCKQGLNLNFLKPHIRVDLLHPLISEDKTHLKTILQKQRTQTSAITEFGRGFGLSLIPKSGQNQQDRRLGSGKCCPNCHSRKPTTISHP